MKNFLLYSFFLRFAPLAGAALCIVVFLTGGGAPLPAQELRATVSVDFAPGFDINERDNFATFRQELQTYLNTQSFTGTQWKNEADKIMWKDEPVQLNVSLTIMGGTQTSYYRATLLITAKRTLYGGQKQSPIAQFLDAKLVFPYQRGASFAYQPLRFDDLLSVLDYYAFLCIGFDMDSFYPLSGTPYFVKAQQIVQLAATSQSFYIPGSEDNGWRMDNLETGRMTRAGLIAELLEARYQEFRSLFAAYHLNGLDYLSDQPAEAKATIDDLLTKFADFKDKLPNRSVLFQLFFDSKFNELADLFRGYPSEKVWEKLKYNDPSHTIIYEDTRTGRRGK
jgi:hypothetical protein